jgi:hypothetical protein
VVVKGMGVYLEDAPTKSAVGGLNLLTIATPLQREALLEVRSDESARRRRMMLGVKECSIEMLRVRKSRTGIVASEFHGKHRLLAQEGVVISLRGHLE